MGTINTALLLYLKAQNAGVKLSQLGQVICMISDDIFPLTYSSWSRSFRADIHIPGLYDLYDLYDLYYQYDLYDQYDQYDLYDLYYLYDLYDLYYLAHVAGWTPYNLHNPANVSWIASVRHRSCTTFQNGRLRSGSSTWSSSSWSVQREKCCLKVDCSYCTEIVLQVKLNAGNLCSVPEAQKFSRTSIQQNSSALEQSTEQQNSSTVEQEHSRIAEE